MNLRRRFAAIRKQFPKPLAGRVPTQEPLGLFFDNAASRPEAGKRV